MNEETVEMLKKAMKNVLKKEEKVFITLCQELDQIDTGFIWHNCPPVLKMNIISCNTRCYPMVKQLLKESTIQEVVL